MAFGRKSAEVGTGLDKEELEELLGRLETAIDDLKAETWNLSEATKKAARVAEDLNKAVHRSELSSRSKLSSKKW